MPCAWVSQDTALQERREVKETAHANVRLLSPAVVTMSVKPPLEFIRARNTKPAVTLEEVKRQL